MEKGKAAKVFKSSILKNNPVLIQLVGLCSVLGVSTSVENAIGMTAAFTFVLICSNIVISLLRNFIPDKVRIPAYIVVIATFVTLVSMMLQAFVPALYSSLGAFVPLIVVNCIILARAESFASKNGVLIKGSNYLEALRYVDTVVFDKTGTLTKGVFNVTKVNAVNVSKDELMEYAAYAEANSNHPIAKSIVKAYNKNLDLGKIGEYEEIAAHGIKVNYNGKTVLAGNEKLMKANNVKYTPVSETGTVVYIAVDGKYAGDLVISDEIKADSKEAIAKLKQIGIKQTVMLTGDNKKVADAVAAELKLDKVYSNLLPDEKVEKIEE